MARSSQKTIDACLGAGKAPSGPTLAAGSVSFGSVCERLMKAVLRLAAAANDDPSRRDVCLSPG